jgi:2,5-furandicarboxylate decarboxylase 1
LIEVTPMYYTEIDKKLSQYEFTALARAFGQLHADGKLWKDPLGRICIRGSKFDAKPR